MSSMIWALPKKASKTIDNTKNNLPIVIAFHLGISLSDLFCKTANLEESTVLLIKFIKFLQTFSG